MKNASDLKKRLDCILSREGLRNTNSMARTRHLGIPKSSYGRQSRTSGKSTLSLTTSEKGNVEKKDFVVTEQRRKRATSCSSNKSGRENVGAGSLFMYKQNQDGQKEAINFKRLSITETLQISPLKEEHYRGRIILTSSRERPYQEEHFLPGFKFADVNLRLNSSAINNLKLKQAFKTKDCKVTTTKKVLEIRMPSVNAAYDAVDRSSARRKKPYFLYRHKNNLM